jgi:hypothetical protein
MAAVAALVTLTPSKSRLLDPHISQIVRGWPSSSSATGANGGFSEPPPWPKSECSFIDLPT